MGAGKKKTNNLKEKSQTSFTVNCSVSARNLRKSELGSVIFGCKNNTISECFSNQLFGLPPAHKAYVQNVSPGLVLFLFNYSDRKLHGIFEAVSHGQMNIDPYAWTDDGTEYTAYGAQVRVCIRNQCHPLTEDQFRPIIADNYYEQRLFWFELDRAQTSKLIALFSSSPVYANASFSQRTTNWNNGGFHSLPAAGTRQARGDIENSVSEANFGQSDQNSAWDAPSPYRETNPSDASAGVEATVGNQNQNSHRSFASVVVSNMSISVPQRKWSALFGSLSASDTNRKDENLTIEALKSTLPPDQSNMKLEVPYIAPYVDIIESSHLSEASGEEVDSLLQSTLVETPLTDTRDEVECYKGVDSLIQSTLVETPVTDTRDEVECYNGVDSGLDLPHSDTYNTEWGSSASTPHLDGESQPSEASRDEDAREIYHDPTEEPVAEMVSEMKSSDIQSVVAKLMQEMEGLKGSQLKQIIKIRELEQELVESKVEIQQLKNRCNVLESAQISHVEVEYEPLKGGCPKIDESVLIVGGFDGSSWLSALGSYSPSCDEMKSLSPMTSVRSYASAAKLNGELYIFGGVYGDSWYDTVESYNLTNNQWAGRPSLNRHKGSLAGASLYDKIFAIGGGNAVECFSEVEMFDLTIGRWIYRESMQHKRLGPAAAEINGTLYVVGGYDGEKYLNTVERFDPRERFWTGVGSMSSRRGCHSLVVLNEKLYSLGGFDGSSMVSTVEVFDPRTGLWMNGEPMINSRAYSGAFISGGKIYIIGGVNHSGKTLDTIECYKEGCGWEVTELKAVGKRCFFSALVL